MRHSSERVPGKNYRPFNGKPLYQWIVETLVASDWIHEVYIDTDSPLLHEQAPTLSKKVKMIQRPEHLRSGHIPMNDILLHDVSLVEADYYLQTHSTNPLLRKVTLEKVVESFLSSKEHDSLFTVTRLQERLWTPDGKAINHDPNKLERTQDLPPVLLENSNLYLFTKKILQERKNRIGFRPMLFEIEEFEAWDIDTELDFQIGQFLATAYPKN